jgi:Helix-turn-helix domain
MAQLLHGSATTTARTRAELQSSEESVAALARRYGVNPKTVAKWRKRDGVEDALRDNPGPMGIQTGSFPQLTRPPHPGT